MLTENSSKSITITVTDSAIDSLNEAVNQIQAHLEGEGLHYNTEAIKQALTNWLELQIESLASDAVFHTVEGSRELAMGRRIFERELDRLVPLAMPQAA